MFHSRPKREKSYNTMNPVVTQAGPEKNVRAVGAFILSSNSAPFIGINYPGRGHWQRTLFTFSVWIGPFGAAEAVETCRRAVRLGRRALAREPSLSRTLRSGAAMSTRGRLMTRNNCSNDGDTLCG